MGVDLYVLGEHALHFSAQSAHAAGHRACERPRAVPLPDPAFLRAQAVARIEEYTERLDGTPDHSALRRTTWYYHYSAEAGVTKLCLYGPHGLEVDLLATGRLLFFDTDWRFRHFVYRLRHEPERVRAWRRYWLHVVGVLGGEQLLYLEDGAFQLAAFDDAASFEQTRRQLTEDFGPPTPLPDLYPFHFDDAVSYQPVYGHEKI